MLDERLDPTCGGPVGALTMADVCAARAYLFRLRAARGRPDRYAEDERIAAAPLDSAERRLPDDVEEAAERVLGAARNFTKKQTSSGSPQGDNYGATNYDQSPDGEQDHMFPAPFTGDSDAHASGLVEGDRRHHWRSACTGGGFARHASRRRRLLKLSSKQDESGGRSGNAASSSASRRRRSQINILGRILSPITPAADPAESNVLSNENEPSPKSNTLFSSISSAASSEGEADVPSSAGRDSLLLQHQNKASWRLAENYDFDQNPSSTRAAEQAVAVVEKIATRMSDYDAPFYDVEGSRKTPDEELKENLLRRRRAAHRLLLGVLSFDGSRGLVAAGESTYNADADPVLDAWYGADDKLSAACAEHRRHLKALSMLQAVCSGLLDVLRGIDRIHAAVRKDSTGGRLRGSSSSSRVKPTRFWADAREKSAQISVLVCRLYKYNSSLPIVNQIRDIRPGEPGPLKQVSRRLHVPMPTDESASRALDEIRAALLEARDCALESLSIVVKTVWDAAVNAVDMRHEKILADIALIDNRFELVENVFCNAHKDRASLRLVYEVMQIMKAQLQDAGIS